MGTQTYVTLLARRAMHGSRAEQRLLLESARRHGTD